MGKGSNLVELLYNIYGRPQISTKRNSSQNHLGQQQGWTRWDSVISSRANILVVVGVRRRRRRSSPMSSRWKCSNKPLPIKCLSAATAPSPTREALWVLHVCTSVPPHSSPPDPPRALPLQAGGSTGKKAAGAIYFNPLIKTLQSISWHWRQ